MAMYHGSAPRDHQASEVASLRDAVAKLERSRQRAEQMAKERAERAAEMQQEIARLHAENRRLAASVRGESYDPEHANHVLDRLVEENQQLQAEREKLLLEVSRVARDNRRLLQEVQRHRDLEPHEAHDFYADLPGRVPREEKPYMGKRLTVHLGGAEGSDLSPVLSEDALSSDSSPQARHFPSKMRGTRDSYKIRDHKESGRRESAERRRPYPVQEEDVPYDNDRASSQRRAHERQNGLRDAGKGTLRRTKGPEESSGSESTGSSYYLNLESGIFETGPGQAHSGTRERGPNYQAERMGYPPSPSTPSESDKSVSTGGRGVSHKRCATHPGHEEADRGRKLVDRKESEEKSGAQKVRGRPATESLPPEYFKSRGMGRAGPLDALSLFTPQPVTPRRRLSTPIPSTLEQFAREPTLPLERENIIEAFFVIDQNCQESRPRQSVKTAGNRRKTRLASLIPGLDQSQSRLSWPEVMQGSDLEQLLVERGFCPGPTDYRFNGNAFVFSLQATAFDPKAHPDDPVPFCMVCSEDLKMSALPADHRKYFGEMMEEEREVTRQDDCDDMMQHIPDGGVLCLVSKIPFFDFGFTLLELLRKNLDKAPRILERINRAGMAKLAHGIQVSDLLGSPHVLGLRAMTQKMPRELLSKGCDWSQLAHLSRHEGSSPLAHTLARWQGWWGLLTLLMRWGDRLMEEVVLKLLPCVLLEQQVVLFGDAQRTCVVAFLLRGMLWPFKWQHLFVGAPWPPEELQNVPLMEAPFPFIFAFGETAMLQHFWGYQNMYELPENIVACLLRDRWVVINEKLKTSGGLTGKTLKFPPFVHAELRSQIKEARNALRNGHGLLEIVQKVHSAIEAAMGKLANLVKRYAQSQVQEEAARSKDVYYDLFERSRDRAIDEERFLSWLHQEPAFGSLEQAAFYKSFYQTQCFMHRIDEEIHSHAEALIQREKQLRN